MRTVFLRLALAAIAATASMPALSDAASGVSSKLQVHIPKTLTQPDGYDHREALFGIPPYGGSLQQNVYYADSDLCDANVDKTQGYPIRAKDENGKMLPWPSPYILMVDRGGCTFVQKVRNAQRSGAAGVLIADNTCLCSFAEQCHSDPGVECESREPIMADDGSGSDISIPSFLMFKQDADPVKAELMANHMVRIEMAWSLPNPDDRVEYEFWSTPTDLVAKDFQKQWKAAATALGARAYFTPHMYIYDGIKSGCQGANDENECYNLCTNNGRYCATDPDNDLDQGISGADVVAESLRRTCIWKYYGEKDGVGGNWWDYVNEFMFRCDTEDYFTNPECIKDAMDHSGIDGSKIDQCMDESGGLDVDKPNSVLEDELKAKENTGVVILPAAFVNGAAIRGALDFAVIFKAICAGYQVGTEPGICVECSNCADEHKCVVNGYCHSPRSDGAVSNQVFGASMFGLVLFFGCVGFIQWRRSQRQTREQVRSILAEYMPLDEENKVSTAIDDETEAEGEFS